MYISFTMRMQVFQTSEHNSISWKFEYQNTFFKNNFMENIMINTTVSENQFETCEAPVVFVIYNVAEVSKPLTRSMLKKNSAGDIC